MTVHALDRRVGGTGSSAPEGLPLTAAQSALWSARNLGPGRPSALSTAEYVDIRGDLDGELFAEALHRTVGEADALRVRFAATPDGPRQVDAGTEPPYRGFPFHIADVRHQGDPVARALEWMRADLALPFDLARGPLFAHVLFHVGGDHWLWYHRAHLAVLDGHGHALFARRVADVYTALVGGARPAASPFGRLAALVAEDAAYRASAAHDRDRAHWRRRLAAHPRPAPTLAGPPVPQGPDAPPPHRHTARLGPRTTARLCDLAVSVRATRTEVLFAAQALYLARATGAETVVLDVPMTGRTGSTALRVPAALAGVLPLCFTVTPDTTFAELARQADVGIRAARRHQRHRPAGPAGGTLVHVVPRRPELSFAGAPATAHVVSSGPVDDLTVTFALGEDGGLRVDHEADPTRYDAGELAAHQQRFVHLLTRLADGDPHRPLSALCLATDEERERVLGEFNDTAVAVPPTTLIGPVEAQAARTPGAPALIAEDLTLTYAELNARANRLARHLIGLGVRPGTRAAVALPRSASLVVALLAVLKAGGAYVALEAADARTRLADAERDPALVCVLTDTATRAALPDTGRPLVVLDDTAAAGDLAGHLPTDPGRPLTPRHPAYVVDGVAVPHAAADNLLRWMQGEHPLTAADRVLVKAPPGSAVLAWEVLAPLRAGAALVVAGEQADTTRTIREQGVTVAHFTPSEVASVTGRTPALTGLREVFCDVSRDGVPLPAEVAGRWCEALPDVPLHQLYGPSEAVGVVAHHRCEPGGPGPVPLGRPVWNTRLHVLDSAGQPCPPGVTGELYVAGEDARPTGVPARWRPDGVLEHAGGAAAAADRPSP
ncbi:AMP-binding protein [Streptomyces cinnamoneus]|uniref:AMP-binding protein n=1 Tax=Streptomyces cinnamoneus TaxID=53446 RepID=UPI00379EA3CC